MSKIATRIAIGERIKTAREAAGYESAVDAAAATSIHVQSVRDHEAGRRGADIGDLVKYAKRYKVSFLWLATGEGGMKKEDRMEPEVAELVNIMRGTMGHETRKQILDFAKWKAQQE